LRVLVEQVVEQVAEKTQHADLNHTAGKCFVEEKAQSHIEDNNSASHPTPALR
jgi:hypothetical protein